MQDREIALLLNVQLQAALVTVHRKKIGTLFLNERGTPMTRLITDAGALDLDDIGAQVSEHHAAIGAG